MDYCENIILRIECIKHLRIYLEEVTDYIEKMV